MIGPNELWIILLLVVILFGGSKLPEIARNLGKASGEFKKAQREAELELIEFERKVRENKFKSYDEKRKKLEELAKSLNIDVEGKSDDELLEEIKKAIPKEKAEP